MFEIVLDMHELFGAWCEKTMFEIVLNMHELFDAGRDETMLEIVLNIHELFAAWGEETMIELFLVKDKVLITVGCPIFSFYIDSQISVHRKFKK
jgi:hypothetical protein